MAKKPHIKPVGTSVSLRHKTGLNIDERLKLRALSPSVKDSIELKVASAFEKNVLILNDGKAVELKQLDEDDLDFFCQEEGRVSKLELTELVLATPPYQEIGDTAKIEVPIFADRLAELVTKKNSKHYSSEVPIDLLIYTTHFAYHGNNHCVELAGERLRHLQLGEKFSRIFYLGYNGGPNELHLLKPYRNTLTPSYRRELEKQWFITMNFNEGTPVEGGTKFEFKL